MMRILVLNPPFLRMYSRASRSPAVAKSNTLYYPIWLAYTTGVLEKEGHDVKLIDAPAMDWTKTDVYDFTKSFKPDLTIVDTTTPSIYNDEEVADNIKELTGTLTVLVGTHASALPLQVLKESRKIDAVAVGEYDFIIRDLARCLYNGNDWKKVPGIVYRDNGRIKFNSQRAKINNLDEIPFVSKVYKKHLYLYIDKYFYGANRHPVITIVSGRGCPYNCGYCVYPQVMFGHKYRVRSVKNLVDELEYIKKNFPKVKEVFLEDDTLTINKSRILELCEEMKRRGLHITWSTNSRAQVDYKTLCVMKEAGCRLLCVGFESASQDVLDRIPKRLKVEEIYEFAKNAKRAGILVHGCFLVGNPGETKETLKETLKMAKILNPDTAQFYPIMVYPGTKAYKWAKEEGYLITEDYSQWLTLEGLHNCVVYRPNLSNKVLVSWANNARKKFYLCPNYVLSKFFQILKHPSELGRIYRGFKSLSRFILKNEIKE